jgi:xylulose-5-phosphate/fructose-6-phosphate phosphoketolase
LSSYDPSTVFTKDGSPNGDILSILPEDNSRRLGQILEIYNGQNAITTPQWMDLAVKRGEQASSMQLVGEYMGRSFQQNPKDLRIFSPDELESNKLTDVFKYTGRNFQWDEYSRNQGGRVIEILSEHSCQG